MPAKLIVLSIWNEVAHFSALQVYVELLVNFEAHAIDVPSRAHEAELLHLNQIEQGSLNLVL